MNNPVLVCPRCCKKIISDLISEIFGYCCLNEDCHVCNIKPDKFWYLNGVYHREDGPAIEYSGGGREWCINGLRHREDGPAMECYDGGRRWYINGLLHREDGPAVEYANGRKEWWTNGKRHSEFPED